MHQNPPDPGKLNELPEATRRFLAGIRDEEWDNLKIFVEMRKDERDLLSFLMREFNVESLQVLRDSLENLRTLRRFGKFSAWLFGVIIAGASVAAMVKTFVLGGGK